MAAIPENFGAAGAGLTPDSSPSLAEILRDMADDLNTLRIGDGNIPTITAPDAVDNTTLYTLANETKARVNELIDLLNRQAGVMLKTTKL